MTTHIHCTCERESKAIYKSMCTCIVSDYDQNVILITTVPTNEKTSESQKLCISNFVLVVPPQMFKFPIISEGSMSLSNIISKGSIDRFNNDYIKCGSV